MIIPTNNQKANLFHRTTENYNYWITYISHFSCAKVGLTGWEVEFKEKKKVIATLYQTQKNALKCVVTVTAGLQ